MKICIVSEAYPAKGEPRFPFVQQLAYSLSNEGVDCSIIAPQSITKIILRREKRKRFFSLDINPEGKEVKVCRPSLLSFSNTKSRLLKAVFDYLFCHAIRRGIKKIGTVDAVYCYFWHVGLRTIRALQKKDFPVFIQASECDITVPDYLKDRKYIDKVAGVVCASGKNKEESVREGLTKACDTIIAVNGYRKDEFYRIEKEEARKTTGISSDKFVISFLGGFIKRKGLPQLCSVLNRFDDVYSILIGQGDLVPSCKNILFKGSLDHKSIVHYLCSSDLFVLPTEAEGCCNAIIEALACGLPVISSNKPFNDEILDETCSIKIDEHDEEELYNAIQKIKEDSELQQKLSLGALKKAESLTIERRAIIIKEFLLSRINSDAN